MEYIKEVTLACNKAIDIIGVKQLNFRPMRRVNNRVNTKRGFVVGRTNLRTGSITIDVLTPTKREPKKISSVLRVLCHEIAHHQKPPFRQLYRWRWIIRQHYPDFYTQVTKNIEVLKKHEELKDYFVSK